MKRFNITLSILLLGMCVFSQAPVELGEGYYDGPYVLYEGNEVRLLSVVPGDDSQARVIDERMPLADMPETITVYPDQQHPDNGERLPPFEVTFWEFEDEIQYEFEQPEELLLVSDYHGYFGPFVELLVARNVMDEDYNWTFGDNYLVYAGDVFSRGNDQTPILWLLYKLQYEAEQAGGRVIYTLGNHEAMHLSGDLRYLHDRYHTFVDHMGVSYNEELYGENSELGRWIRSKNTIVQIGSYLVTHAGISPEFVEEGYTIQEANNLIREHIGTPNSELDPRPYFLFRTWGPLWYRGMSRTEEDRRPVFGDDVAALLDHFDVDRFLIGHNHDSEVRYHRDNMVISFATYPHLRARENNLSQGLLITRGDDGANTYKGVFEDGSTRELPLWD